MDAHDLVSKLKDLAIDLGRTPSRDEFTKTIKGGKHHITRAFGTYAVLVQASGLDPVSTTRQKKLGNEIFERDLVEVLEAHEPRPRQPPPKYEPTLIIGDTHFPFVLDQALEAIYSRISILKPKRVIQVGDLYDAYAHSKFPRSLNVYSPQQEEKLGREGAEKMWKTIRSIVPQAECVQLLGNHDIRPLKRTIESLPALEHVIVRYLHELMTFEGVTLISDSRQEYFFDDVQVLHGYRTGLGSHRDHNLKNTVCGHTHKGGVTYRRVAGRTLWELNAGLVGDPESKVMGYTPQKTHDCTVGWGEIDELGPRFVAL